MHVRVSSTGIVWNELIGLICGYANIVHTSSSFCPHTHTHSLSHHNYEDRESMGLKVDIGHCRLIKFCSLT